MSNPTSSSRKLSGNDDEITSSDKSSLKESDIHVLTETEEDVTSEVILSIIWQGNKLGAAFYNVDTCCLYLMPDHAETEPVFSVLKLLLNQIEPVCIVTCGRTDERLISVLREFYSQEENSETGRNSGESSKERKRLYFLPNLDFAYEVCKHRLQNLKIPGIPKHMNDVEKRIYFSSWIDFTNTCMIKAAGGLLKYIENGNFGRILDSQSCPVVSISTFSLRHIVNIDENVYKALQIFQGERHPSVYKSSFGIKEGLSLYGVCNKCKSAIGRKELKRWFLMPTNDKSLIMQRQAAVKYFASTKNSEITSALQKSLKQIKFISRILTRMKTSQASMNDWQALYKTSYHAMVMGEICHSHSADLEIFNEIGVAFSSDLFRIASLLNKIIDFDEFARQNHFTVKTGVDSELDKMKRRYHGLPDFMTKIAYEELQKLDPDIQQCSVIYLPQLGYLLAIPMTEQMKVTKNYALSNFKFMSWMQLWEIHYVTFMIRRLK